MHITVRICTYKRPVMLRRLLNETSRLDTAGLFSYSIVVADNDEEQSGRQVVLECAAAAPVEVSYFHEPRRSISHARNKTLQNARGEAIAFIDDDEFPTKVWLLNLFKTWQEHKVAGVLGPVRPYFNDDAPAWVRRGGFYDRPEHATGFVMRWQESRTGNVLLDRKIIAGADPVFDPAFGAAGGDMDFFRRMMAQGHQFIWSNEAVVFEEVPPHRATLRFLLQRAFFRGGGSLQHPEGRWLIVAKSMAAVPLYVLALPFLFLAGRHLSCVTW